MKKLYALLAVIITGCIMEPKPSVHVSLTQGYVQIAAPEFNLGAWAPGTFVHSSYEEDVPKYIDYTLIRGWLGGGYLQYVIGDKMKIKKLPQTSEKQLFLYFEFAEDEGRQKQWRGEVRIFLTSTGVLEFEQKIEKKEYDGFGPPPSRP